MVFVRHRASSPTLCVVVGLANGCAGNPSTAPDLTTAGSPVAAGEHLAGRAQRATLHLARGKSSARFAITALAPPTHTFDVRVGAPAAADVGVRIRTWYGVPLRILNSTHNPDRCRSAGGRSSCYVPFPLLEAQRAGRWTVIASKRSRHPADVAITITFSQAMPQSNP